VNIGPNGAFLYCPVLLDRNEKLTLFIVAPRRQPMKVRSVVTWSNRYGSDEDTPPRGMGVRFVDIAEEDRSHLLQLFRGLENAKLQQLGSRMESSLEGKIAPLEMRQ